jgi:tRNA/tmRNA/rRNA uracil-C5-methylase (TrmA/RlmC/RlmD family)
LPELTALVQRIGFRGDVWFACDERGEGPVLEFKGIYRGAFRRAKLDLAGAAGLVFKNARGRILVHRGKPTVDVQWNDMRVALNPARFFQSNPASWPTFFQWVHAFVTSFQLERVWDVHAGSGFLSSCLSGLQVLASEPEAAACKRLVRGFADAGIEAEVFQGSDEEALEAGYQLNEAGDGLILDPPREGLSKRLRQWIVEEGPDALLYFSCDMGSFARDLRQLMTAFEPVSPILAMNVNPGTLRLETAVMLARRPRD